MNSCWLSAVTYNMVIVSHLWKNAIIASYIINAHVKVQLQDNLPSALLEVDLCIWEKLRICTPVLRWDDYWRLDLYWYLYSNNTENDSLFHFLLKVDNYGSVKMWNIVFV